MAKIDELLKQQNYNKIIELYADSNDIEEMFAYAISLAVLSRCKEADDYFIRHNDILINQPVRLINSHINTYLFINDFSNARRVLEYYENKPYISQEVEECFIAIKSKISQLEKQSLQRDDLDIVTIKKYLASKNDSLIQKAIMKMRDYKIDLFVSELKKILVDSSLKASTRMLTLMILKIENCKGVFDFYYFIENKILSVDLNDIALIDYQTYSMRFSDRLLTINNSSVQETFIGYLQTFDMMFFPYPCPYNDDAIFFGLLLYCYELYALDTTEIKKKIANNKISLNDIESINLLLTNQIKDFLQ